MIAFDSPLSFSKRTIDRVAPYHECDIEHSLIFYMLFNHNYTTQLRSPTIINDFVPVSSEKKSVHMYSW